MSDADAAQRHDQPDLSARKVFGRALARAGRNLWLEAFTRLAAPMAIALAGVLALGLLGAWDALPYLARVLGVWLILGAGAYGTVRAAARFRRPTRADALARLAEDADLDLRPFEILEDAPIARDPDALALWRDEAERAAAAASAARAKGRRMALLEADPWGLRFVALAGVLAGLFLSADDLGRRALSGFNPGLAGTGAGARVDVWIEPPSYAAAAPRLLSVSVSEGEGELVRALEGSELVARLTGARGSLILGYTGEEGRTRLRAKRLESGEREARLVLDGDGVARVTAPGARRSWTISVSPDAPPTAAWASVPRLSGAEDLDIGFVAEDDHGVAHVALEIELADPPEALRGAGRQSFTLSDGAGGLKRVETTKSLHLVEHAWTGLLVRGRISARDALGQEGLSGWEEFYLPATPYTVPLARAAQDVRLTLLRGPKDYAPADGAPAAVRLAPVDPSGGLGAPPLTPLRIEAAEDALPRAPESVRWAHDALTALTMAGERFAEDLPVQLALELARQTLRQQEGEIAVSAAANLLWDAAQRAEFGDLASAREALMRAMEAMRDALRRGAGPDELAQRMQILREAVARYLAALAREGLQADPEMAGGGPGGASLGMSDLEEMLNALDDAAQSGLGDDAATMLQRLEELLANLQVQMGGGGGGDGIPMPGEPNEDLMTEREKELREQLGALADMIDEQRALMDEAQREASRQRAEQRGETGEGRQAGEGQRGQGQQGQGQQGQGQQGQGQQGQSQQGLGQQGQGQEGQDQQGGGGSSGEPRGPGAIGADQRALAEAADAIARMLEQQGAGAGQGGEQTGEQGAGQGDSQDGERGGGLGDAEQGLERAQRSMGRAARDLEEGNPGGAITDQRLAVQALREAAEGLAGEVFAEQMRREGRDMGDAGQAGEGGRTDPLGRRADGGSGGFATGDNMVPELRDRQRARDLLEELRRRAADPETDPVTRSYIERLLERFDGLF